MADNEQVTHAILDGKLKQLTTSLDGMKDHVDLKYDAVTSKMDCVAERLKEDRDRLSAKIDAHIDTTAKTLANHGTRITGIEHLRSMGKGAWWLLLFIVPLLFGVVDAALDQFIDWLAQ